MSLNYSRNYGHDPSKYVSIHPSDFDTYLSMTDIADRILSDECFDKECRKMAEARERQKNGGSQLWND